MSRWPLALRPLVKPGVFITPLVMVSGCGTMTEAPEVTVSLEATIPVTGDFCGAAELVGEVFWCTRQAGISIRSKSPAANLVELGEEGWAWLSLRPWRGDSAAVFLQRPRSLAFFDSGGNAGPFLSLHQRLGTFYGSNLGPVAEKGVGILVSSAQRMPVAERMEARLERQEGWTEGDSVLVVLETPESFEVIGILPTPRQYWLFNSEEKGWLATRPPLFPRRLTSAGPGLIASVETQTGSVTVWEIPGEASTWTVRDASGKVEEAAWRGYAKSWIQTAPEEQRSDLRRALSLIGPPEVGHLIDSIFVDRLQRVWVRQLSPIYSDTANWRVFASDGVPLFQLQLSRAEKLVDASSTFLLTHMQDSLRQDLRLFSLIGVGVPGT